MESASYNLMLNLKQSRCQFPRQTFGICFVKGSDYRTDQRQQILFLPTSPNALALYPVYNSTLCHVAIWGGGSHSTVCKSGKSDLARQLLMREPYILNETNL